MLNERIYMTISLGLSASEVSVRTQRLVSLMKMKIGPKAILVISVVTLVGIGSWLRAAYAKPWMDRKAAESITLGLEHSDTLKLGDIIFQTSRSPQSRAIQFATHSPWSHCGILVRRQGHWSVLEAAQPVKYTSLSEWIGRGKEGKFMVMRVRATSSHHGPSDIQALVNTGATFLGKSYDPLFGWGDDRIYCSELVWKTYHRAWGVDLGQIQTLGQLDLSSPSAPSLKKARLGSGDLPTDTLITPEAIRRSPLLELVVENP